MSARCEPPPELRDREHEAHIELHGYEFVSRWFPKYAGWQLPDARGTTPEDAWRIGWRYLSPVATPAEVATLRARVAELEGALRDIAAAKTWMGEHGDFGAGHDAACEWAQDIARAALSPTREPAQGGQ